MFFFLILRLVAMRVFFLRVGGRKIRRRVRLKRCFAKKSFRVMVTTSKKSHRYDANCGRAALTGTEN